MGNPYTRIKVMANRVRDIPLIDVMRMTGSVRDKYDKQKWHTSKGVISITGQKFLNWSYQTGGGGAIDLIMHLLQLDFIPSVIWFSRRFPDGSPPLAPQRQSADHYVFQVPKKCDHNLPAVIYYLHHARKIPMDLLQQLVRSGKLYADIRSNAVFLLLGKEKKAVGAELRGTSQKRWVGMTRGSRKDLGAFSIKTQFPKNIIICESAIDAMSYFALHPNCIAVSTAGATPAPSWLYQLVKHDIEILCGFDDDETGNRNADEMIRLFPKIKRLKPEKYDWNEVLKSSL